MKNAFRSLGNSLGNDPLYADLWPTWKDWQGLQDEDYKHILSDQPVPELLSHVQSQVKPALGILKQRLRG